MAELSGGERQRLLLAQALLGRPRLLLLDEPLISLDPHHQGAVVALVARLQQALGLTVLFSAHDLNPLLGAMDQVLYLAAASRGAGHRRGVITAPVLSRLYGAPIEVAHVNGRIFVLSGGQLADGHCVPGMPMFEYDFMVNAFAAATEWWRWSRGLVGYLLVLRGQAFAGHALGHVGFAGATGAVLLGAVAALGPGAGDGGGRRRHGRAGPPPDRRRMSPSAWCCRCRWGWGCCSCISSPPMRRRRRRCCSATCWGWTAPRCGRWRGWRCCAWRLLAVIARPLLFASLQPELAEARGVDLRLLSVLFLALVGLAVAECAQIVGVLLVFTLMVGPAATAQRCTVRLWPGVALSAGLAVATSWGALALAFYTDWPTSFWITTISGAGYGAAVVARR